MSGPTVSILEGNTFVVSDRAGNIEASLSDPVGLFAWDTRYLSRWILSVDGLVPNVLSTDDLHYYETQFFLVPGTGTIYVDAELSIIRKRAVGSGFSEEIRIRNESAKPTLERRVGERHHRQLPLRIDEVAMPIGASECPGSR